VIWREFAQDPFAKGALLGLLGLWIATLVVIWLYVGYDLRQILQERERDSRWARSPLPLTHGGTTMFESLEDLTTRLSATGYFIDPVMTQVVFLAAKLQKPLILEGPAGAGKSMKSC